jgi:hypothetical protein
MSTPDLAPTDPRTFAPDGQFDDDWDDTPITPRARAPWLTKLLAVAVVAGLAFVGGVYAHKQWGSSSSSSATGGTSAFAAARRAGGFGGFSRASGAGSGGATGFGSSGGATGFGGAASQPTSGQVSYIKGSTLYVADLTGGTVKVSTAGARVSKTTTITPQLIHPGDTVVVVGTKQANGTIAATSITVGGGVSALLGGG